MPRAQLIRPLSEPHATQETHWIDSFLSDLFAWLELFWPSL